jgi:hypothetical protein
MKQIHLNQRNWAPSNLGQSFYASKESDDGFLT